MKIEIKKTVWILGFCWCYCSGLWPWLPDGRFTGNLRPYY